MSEIRGRFVWNELNTTDPDAAIPFYKKVVGWGVQAWDDNPSYRIWTAKGAPMGGLMTLPEEARRMGAPPHWLTYIGVDNVDATVSQATGRGGRAYVPPTDIPNVGRFAVLADPQGATFAILKPSTPGVPSDEPPIGDFSWHELATTDWKAAWEFYRVLFGWEHESSFDMGPEAGTYFMFKRAGGARPMGGMYNKPGSMPAPPHWLPYARVASADKAAAAATAAGGQVVNGPMEVPGGDRVAMMLDPQGAAFAVHAVKAAAPAKPKPATKKKAKAKPKARSKAKPKAKRAKPKARQRARPAARKAKGRKKRAVRRRR